MEKIENREGEITLIYNSDRLDDRQALTYLRGIDKKLRTIDIVEERLSESEIIALAKEMDVDLQSLVDSNNRLLYHEIENGNLSKESLLKLLSLRPDFLKTPIAVWDGKVKYWDSAFEAIKRDANYDQRHN